MRVTGICLLMMVLFFSCSSYAASSQAKSKTDLYQEIQKIRLREQQLAQEVQGLKSQLDRANQKKATSPKPHHNKNKKHSLPHPDGKHYTHRHIHVIGKDKIAESKEKPFYENEWMRGRYAYFGPLRFVHGITVTTSPVLGFKSAYNLSDLLYQYPSMNEDLILLQQRENFQRALMSVGDTLNNRAIVIISGGLEGQIVAIRNFNGLSQGDVNLNTAEIDFGVMVSKWTNMLIALDYDDSTPATGSRVVNSRIYLSRGWFTIGNLSDTPVYFSIGQMYLPFGVYTTTMITAPLTLSLGRIDARTVVLGYYKEGFYGEVYGYRGSKTTGVDNVFKQGGINLGYHTVGLPHSAVFDFGVGVVTNLGDSQGSQRNGLRPNESNVRLVSGAFVTAPTQYPGFGEVQGGNALVHDVAAVDVHTEFHHKGLGLLAEYVGAVQSYDPSNMSINNRGARPQAAHFEVNYTIQVHNKPITFAVTYGRTWDALAMNLPNYSASLDISTSVWKNTSLGIEYRYDLDYPAGTTATGTTDGRSATNLPARLPVPTATGRQRNMITVQFGAYF